MTKDLTTGSILKNVIFFSLPFLLSFFMQTLYGLADLYVIGRFCDVDSTTAVSIGGQVMHMLTVMIVGLSMGTTVLIGNAVGAGERKLKNEAIGNTTSLFLVVSIVLAVILLVLTMPVVSIMSTPEEAVEGAADYLRICFIGIPFVAAYNVISAIFRGLGDSKSPMYFVAVACVFNIGLDFLFIGGLGMGPSGAALGTTLAQAVSVLVAVTAIVKRKIFEGIKGEDFRLQKRIWGKILKVGIPVSAQDGFIQVSFVLIMIFANMRGLDDAAAVGIVEKLIGLLFLVPSSLLSSVSAICAQNIGAGKEERAKKTLLYAAFIAVGWGLVSGIAFQFIAPGIVGQFTKEAHVVLLGTQYMRAYVWDCMLAGIHFTFSGYFCACSRSGISFIHNVISIITARVPIAYFASKAFADTLYPMGLGAPIGSLISAVICIGVFIYLERKRNRNVVIS